jgi:Holliday junction resolvase RusA-like endonuclease
MEIKLELPFPPTVNNLFADGKKGGRFKTPAYKAWRAEAGWLVKQQVGGQKITGVYTLEILLVRPDKRTRDASNYIKAVEDLLVWLSVTEDDTNCRKVSAEWVEEGPPCVAIVRGEQHES